MVSEEVDTFECIEDEVIKPWQVRYLLGGIILPVVGWVAIYLLNFITYLRVRPWVSGPLFMWLYFFMLLGVPLYYVMVLRKCGVEPFYQIGSFKGFCKELLYSILLMFVLGVVLYVVVAVLGLFKMEIGTPARWLQFRGAPGSKLMFFFLAMGFTIVPLAEEICFRGFLYNLFKRRLAIPLAVVLQAILFALVHGYDLGNSVIVVVIGIFLACVYEMRKNLLAPTLMHCLMNAMWCGPIIAGMIINAHVPAKDWSEARVDPVWLDVSMFDDVERQETGMVQWQYAVDRWGSWGSQEWKREVKAFEAVFEWFGEDRNACAKARAGMVEIFSTRLVDYRRAVVEAERFINEYPDQKEQSAWALCRMGWAYYMLKDFSKSREAFERVISEFDEFEFSLSEAEQGIGMLDALEG